MTEKTLASHQLFITTGTTRFKKVGKQQQLTVKALFDRLSQPVKLAVSETDYRALEPNSKAQDDIKDSGWFQFGEIDKEKRWPRNRWGLTIDIDNGSSQTLTKIEKLYSRYAYFVYETISSTEDKPRYRLVIPFDSPIDLDEHKALATLVCHEISSKECDVTTSAKGASLFFWPVQFTDTENSITLNATENFMSPVVYLETMWQHRFEGSHTDVSTWPQTQRKHIKAATYQSLNGLQENPAIKAGLIGDFCRTYTIHDAIDKFLSDTWIKEDEDRYTYAASGTRNGGAVYSNDRGDTDASFFYSFHGTDPYSELQLNAFDLVRCHRFGHLDHDSRAQKDQSYPSYKAMRDLIVDDETVKEHAAKASSEDFKNNVVSMSEHREGNLALAPEPAPIPDEFDPDDKDDSYFNVWDKPGDDFVILKDYKADGKWEVAEMNIAHTIGSLCASGIVQVNSRLNAIVVRGGLKYQGETIFEPLHPSDAFSGRRITDDEHSSIVRTIEHHRPWKRLPLPRTLCTTALRATAAKRMFDPVIDYLDSLPEWDGKTDCGEVLTQNIKGIVKSDYVRDCTRRWLMQAIHRAKRPGCRVEQVLVLYGASGRGKSSVFRGLCPDPTMFHDEPKIHAGPKEFAESIAGRWIVEMGEMDGVKGARAKKIKGFLSQSEDVYRPAYALNTTEKKRDFIFYGTCNDTTWLRNDMSERRWLPVEVVDKGRWSNAKMDKKEAAMNANRDQYWAHALHLYKKAGYTIPRMPDALVEQQLIATADVMMEDAYDSAQAQCEAYIESQSKQRLCVLEVIAKVFGKLDTSTQGVERQSARKAFKSLGWKAADEENAKITVAEQHKITYFDSKGNVCELSTAKQRAFESPNFKKNRSQSF